jgi:hypothetical protein
MNGDSQSLRQVDSVRFLDHLTQKLVQGWIGLRTQWGRPAEIPWTPLSWPLADSTPALIIRWPGAQDRSALRPGRGATEPVVERNLLPHPAAHGDSRECSPLPPVQPPPRGGTRPEHAPVPTTVAGA